MRERGERGKVKSKKEKGERGKEISGRFPVFDVIFDIQEGRNYHSLVKKFINNSEIIGFGVDIRCLERLDSDQFCYIAHKGDYLYMNRDVKPEARSNDIITREILSETLVYDLHKNRAFCLNETSSRVWALCDGSRSVADIADALSAQTKSVVSEELVLLALDQFRRDRLLNESEQAAGGFIGVSRREVLGRIGAASAIALPVISAIVAPSAVQAQSNCIAPGNPCIIATPPPCCGTCLPTFSNLPGEPGTCIP